VKWLWDRLLSELIVAGNTGSDSRQVYVIIEDHRTALQHLGLMVWLVVYILFVCLCFYVIIDFLFTTLSCWLMPGFHHSVAVAVSLFRCAIVTFRCTVAVIPFRSYRCRCGWEWKCWKCLSVYIGMKWPERWLVVHLRQNGKKRFDAIATEQRFRCNGRWQRQWRNGIFHVSNVILKVLT